MSIWLTVKTTIPVQDINQANAQQGNEGNEPSGFKIGNGGNWRKSEE
jgi:hypothetical protein